METIINDEGDYIKIEKQSDDSFYFSIFNKKGTSATPRGFIKMKYLKNLCSDLAEFVFQSLIAS